MTSLETHLVPSDARAALARDVREGLMGSLKSLPPRWFYDEAGSRLFDEITRLTEYYPTRAERELLRGCATEIASRSGADTLVELGSGTSEKTRLLLDALRENRSLRRFVAVDVDPVVLAEAADQLHAEYPETTIEGVVADFEQHLHLLPREGRRMIAFLGSTIGNLGPAERAHFLTSVRASLRPGDTFLLGTDLVKDVDRLVAAYDDSQGVTAAFNLNILTVLNRELGADFDLDSFRHVVEWNDVDEWIEMRLESTREQVVRIPALDLDVRFDRGEQVRTEISAKFRRERLVAELDDAGLRVRGWWSDGDVALSMSTPA